MRRLRVGLAQINPTVGDYQGNLERILHYIRMAEREGVDIVAFPELALPGYPPEDLLLKPSFIADGVEALDALAREVGDIVVVVGFVDRDDDLYNAAAVLYQGKVAGIYRKHYLPNYGVFDEERYFQAGPERQPVYVVRGVTVGISICEDIWYPGGPVLLQGLSGCELAININGSPYHAGKQAFRERMVATRASDNVMAIGYVNMVGGQDELVFDGNSLILDQQGNAIARGPSFEEALVVADLDAESVFRSRLHDPRRRRTKREVEPLPRVVLSEAPPEPRPPVRPTWHEPLRDWAEVYTALVVGTRDYVRKNRFRQAVIGLSGGIDSSLVACIAVDALGAENVVGVSMPSRYSSPGSKEDARLLAQNLGIRLLTIPIEKVFTAMLDTLSDAFAGTAPDVTEENIQARIRGNILMALSNKFGYLVLTTGNKSELAVGYATLYGDMAGGFAVIKDVPKTWVYALARHRNTISPVIPESVLVKEPSAELRPGQRDVDTLPPYDILDPILKMYVEEDSSPEDIVLAGYDEATVRRVVAMVDRNEYKRRQAAPGIKITSRAFGRDRRLPITNWYRG
jgi:NAD+ synthase (glutamine-hydrolysing)